MYKRQEPYEWVAQQFKDWAFTLTTSILYYNDYNLIDEDTRNLYRMGMAAFGGIAPSYHIELLDKPTIYWDFHSPVSYTHLDVYKRQPFDLRQKSSRISQALILE